LNQKLGIVHSRDFAAGHKGIYAIEDLVSEPLFAVGA
jgi:hypothetical protein